MRCTALLILMMAGGCADIAPIATPAAETAQARTLRLWTGSCALCHVDGNAGAPRLGNVVEWQDRLAQGEGVLLQHTLDGLNDMPPLGYCMSCERDDFAALIRLMTSAVSETGS